MSREAPDAATPAGGTGFEIAPLVLGGNVFGWTADEKTTFGLLDGFVDAGLNAIDTADAYSRWVPGNGGGESETIIGNWLGPNPGKRDRSSSSPRSAPRWDRARRACRRARSCEAVEASLRRCGVEAIDLYLSHWPDARRPTRRRSAPTTS